MEKLIPPISGIYVLIGIVFILALLGFLVSVIFEMYARVVGLRSKMLLRGIKQMFQGDNELFHAFINHPHMRQYTFYDRPGLGGRMPSYLSSAVFTDTFVDLFETKLEENGAKTDRFSENRDLNAFILGKWEAAHRNKVIFSRLIQNWYNEKMNQTSADFTTHANYTVYFLSIGVAIFFNAGIGTLYTRVSHSFEKPPAEHITVITENLQKLVAIDSSLAHDSSVQVIKRNLLGQMNYVLNDHPEPLLGYTNSTLLRSESFTRWLWWMLGILMSAFVMTLSAFLGMEYLKQKTAVRVGPAPEPDAVQEVVQPPVITRPPAQ